MEFEWDEDNRRFNLEKHGIDFEDAIAIWEGDVVQSVSGQSQYAEARFLALGCWQAALFALSLRIKAKGRASSARGGQGIMSGKITRRRLSEKLQGKTDWKRVDALTDADIATAIQNDPGTSEASREWFRDAMVLRPATDKEPITVRLDSDMVTWFRSQGRGYQTRMNGILRSYYEAHRGNPRR